jgi:hypothetical protein
VRSTEGWAPHGLPRRSWLALALAAPWAVHATDDDPASPPAEAPRPVVPWDRQRLRRLGPPAASSNWDAFKLQAAQRMVDSHPDTSYLGKPPEPLLGIPVIETELHADGRVRHVRVVREPREAKETIAMALAVVRRAAPYGDVSHLPKPWKFVEVFLFDDDHRFKPATLDR